MRIITLATLALALLANTACGQPATDESLPPAEQFYLFLLVGQSNMAGRGKVSPADQEPHPRVLMLTQEGKWTAAVDPLHFDKSSAGVGLGRTFGIEMAKAYPGATIGLIPAAAGGSPIASWEPGGYHHQTKSHPYDEAMRRAKLAMQQGTLKGILWHQGESDSNPAAAKVYQQKLHELIARFRKELGVAEVPFLAGQLGQFPERPWNDAKKQVDQAHRDLKQAVVHAAFVSSDGLGHKGDKVHFSAEAYREFGTRYAKAYLEMVRAEQESNE